MSDTIFQSIKVGQGYTATQLGLYLGSQVEFNVDLGGGIKATRRYVLVKAAAAIATAASKVLVTAVSSGVPTWVVNTTTTAANFLVCGVVPEGTVGSDGTTGLVADDYFLLQISGHCKLLTVTASTAAGAGLITSTTAGQADPIDSTFGIIDPGTVFATLLETSAAGLSDVRLVRLW